MEQLESREWGETKFESLVFERLDFALRNECEIEEPRPKWYKERHRAFYEQVEEAALIVIAAWKQDIRCNHLYAEKRVTLRANRVLIVEKNLPKIYSAKDPKPLNPSTGRECLENGYMATSVTGINSFFTALIKKLPKGTIWSNEFIDTYYGNGYAPSRYVYSFSITFYMDDN